MQEHYYRTPPQIERGWRHYLMSTAGRCYLDMVNNVTVLGHAHPRVAEAAARQLRKLNTNSRFNYEAVVEFSERLAATLPEPLDTVFLVNSGSEASDLAMRLATAATGRRDVVAVREAYHGWTYAHRCGVDVDRGQPECACHPAGLGAHGGVAQQLPRQVPRRRRRPVRRRCGAPDRGARRRRADRRRRSSARAVYGNAGGMALPDGYLQQVYAAVRAAGGLAIADEVQVGYGRLGEWFWGFQQQDVVPDIVSIAKSTGNGYPLGAVITSRADRRRVPVAGLLLLLDRRQPAVVRDRHHRARRAARRGPAGQRRARRRAPQGPAAGAARHGTRSSAPCTASGSTSASRWSATADTLEPATEETAAICDRMLELGVVIQPTGDHQNILKTKPPLCIDVDAGRLLRRHARPGAHRGLVDLAALVAFVFGFVFVFFVAALVVGE